MTGRVKSGNARIEVEIEKNREEGNWLKVIELAEQLKDKSPELADFLIGEGRLENYLEERPPIVENVFIAKRDLIEAKRNLTMVTTEAGVKAGVAMDAHLLLGKLCYACGQAGEAARHFAQADLQHLSEKRLPLRSLRIVAESYAVQALCLQREPAPATKFKKAERDEQVAAGLARASDLALLYMQKAERDQHAAAVPPPSAGSHSPQPPGPHKTLGVLLEQGLLNAPDVLIQQGKYQQALERYRASLCAVETQGTHNIRLKLMCRMAELLLQGLVGDGYKPPTPMPLKPSVWKPKYYTKKPQFDPRSEQEEVLLALVIAESMAVKNTVLSQSPEFKEVRLSAYRDATTVYDLLTVATVRWGQVSLLEESLERSLKFAFEEPHVWRQHALSLLSIGQYERALGVLKEAIRLEPRNQAHKLLAAKLCYEHLNLPNEGIEFSLAARDAELGDQSGLLGRCYLYTGIGYHLLAESTLLKKEKDDLRSKALDNIRSAVELEPNDHLSRYYLGLQLAITGNIAEAQRHIRNGLGLHPEHNNMLHLLILLLTADGEYKLALSVVENALEEYPDCLNLMYVKAHLQLHENGGEMALATTKQMLELWKSLYESQTISDVPECDRKSDTRSVFQLYTSEMSDKDSSSLQLHNAAVVRAEQALSEVASSMSGFSPRPGPRRAWLLQLEVWLLMAELYLAADRPDDAQQCVQEAQQIYPLSHHIMHMKGLLHVHREQWAEARQCFQNAAAINPAHVRSLQQLGLVYHYLGLQGLAETTLREAAKVEPHNHVTWYNLGKVLEALGEYEKASSAMATALTEEQNSPILPFNSVPLCFQ